jgi:hypothetical protein
VNQILLADPALDHWGGRNGIHYNARYASTPPLSPSLVTSKGDPCSDVVSLDLLRSGPLWS